MKVEVTIVGGLNIGGCSSTGESVAQETDRRWYAELADEATVQDLVTHLGLPDRDIHLVLINGHHADRYSVLHDGDGVAFTGEMVGD